MRLTCSLIVALLLGVVSARAEDCRLDNIVRDYLGAKHANQTLRVAVYDTKDKTWHAYRWDGINIFPEPRSIEVSFTNEPTLFVRRGEQPVVLIANANPLLYSSEVTSAKRADIEGLADLQALAALLGKDFQKLPHVARVPLPSPTFTEAQINTILSRINAMRDIEGLSSLKTQAAQTQVTDAWDQLRPIIDDLSNALEKEAALLEHALTDAKQPILNAKDVSTELDSTRSGIVRVLQEAELGKQDASAPDAFAKLKDLRQSTIDTLTKGDAAAATLGKFEPACTNSIGAVDRALRVILNDTPADPDTADEARQQLRSALRKLHRDAVNDDCPSADHVALNDALIRFGTWLDDPENRAAARAEDQIQRALELTREQTTKYAKLVSTRDDVLSAAEKFHDKRDAAVKLATQLQQFGAIATSSQLNGSTCWMRAGVVEVQRLQKDGSFPWFQVQTEDYTMTVRALFKDDVVRELPDEVKGSYSLSRPRTGFGVDTAYVFTHANDREYKTAPHQATTDLNNDGKIDEKDMDARIVESSRTNRSATLAMMLTVAPPWLHGVGAQFGLGLDTDNPSAFLGLTLNLGKFARLSAGHTQQRVTRLAGSQTVGGIIPTADDLKTRERFDASWYAALAFRLSELPIFKGSDK